jgi:hypothetical protein
MNNSILSKLSDKERKDYEALSKIFSKNLNENQLTQSIQYLKKNWKNYSKAMLMALLLNPAIASALETNAPEVYNAIKTEIPTDTITSKTTQTPGTKYEKSFDFSNNFKSGETLLTNKESLQNIIGDIQNFTKNKNKARYTITIQASESQVTNPKGYGKGELAKERANNLQQVFEKLGFNNIDVKTEIGKTPYVAGKNNPQDQAYTDEQFVKVIISLNAQDLCSFSQDGADINLGQGSASNDYITFDEIIAGKGIIEFTPESIPDRLVLLDQNGKIKQDTGYISTKKSQYTQWKYVPMYVAGLTQMSGEAVQGSKIKKIKADNLDNLVKQLLSTSYDWKKDKRREVKEGLDNLQKLLDSGVTEFIIYDTLSGSQNVPFNSDNNDSQIKIYSPLGQTGYNIKGVCKI